MGLIVSFSTVPGVFSALVNPMLALGTSMSHQAALAD